MRSLLTRLLGWRPTLTFSRPPMTLGHAGPGMAFYPFTDEAGEVHLQPRDWIYYRDAAGNLSRQVRPTIERLDAAGIVYWEPVWVPDALRLTDKEYFASISTPYSHEKA